MGDGMNVGYVGTHGTQYVCGGPQWVSHDRHQNAMTWLSVNESSLYVNVAYFNRNWEQIPYSECWCPFA